MKGTVKYATACLFGSYVSVGVPSFWNSFTAWKPNAELVLDVPESERRSKTAKWRSVWRKLLKKPITVLVIGKTYMRTGWREYMEHGADFGSMGQVEVWRVVPYSEDDPRYFKPLECLEIDLFNTYSDAQKSLRAEYIEKLGGVL